MKKQEAENHIMDRSQTGAYELLKATVNDPAMYRILLGQFEIPKNGNEDEAWIPLAILKDKNLSIDYRGRVQSDGGACCIHQNRVGDHGNAHLGDGGIWLWDTD